MSPQRSSTAGTPLPGFRSTSSESFMKGLPHTLGLEGNSEPGITRVSLQAD